MAGEGWETLRCPAAGFRLAGRARTTLLLAGGDEGKIKAISFMSRLLSAMSLVLHPPHHAWAHVLTHTVPLFLWNSLVVA